MDRLYIALAAFFGGLAVAYAGWLDSKEPFNPRKFGASVIRALFAAVLFAAGYHLSGAVGMLDLFYAFIGGMGVDVAGNRIAGIFGNGAWPLPSSDNTEPPTASPGEDT